MCWIPADVKGPHWKAAVARVRVARRERTRRSERTETPRAPLAAVGGALTARFFFLSFFLLSVT